MVNLLTKIRLKEKVGTQITFSRIKAEVSWTVPMCVTRTFSPFGKCTKEDIELVILVNKDMEWMMWSVAPVSKIQVSALWAILFEGFSTKIEFFKLRLTKSWKEAQEIPKRAKLAAWIKS